MASEALQELIAGMRAGGPDFSGDLSRARDEFEALLATMPVDAGFSFNDVQLGGVAALHCKTGPARAGALLYLHGGAFVSGSAQGYRGLAANVGQAAGLPTYALDYRLAPEHPFPAAIDDALTAYRALLSSGMKADRIVIAGDSAGGGLALSLLVKLREEGLEMPAAAYLLSPWADLSCSGGSMQSKAQADPALTEKGLHIAAGQYLAGTPVGDPLASPAHADLSGLPPLLVQVGSAEILLDDAVMVASRAGAAGTHVQLEIWPDMPHVWQSFAFMLDEGRAALDAAGAFMRNHTSGASHA
ncbi:alpha/beta hydrolase [Alteraurantiacibacter aestuarii]|uniref:Alpha/beta hydrolase fold domain-containing protein n=1 Tax=Alteraurantiacibacter aestuarii TaxID=650004 RepID=A0A844ZR02_9SPHN|nr:alpha/beta hydrolase [Alteraurantiacibacter aestuarii]MXO88039.1 alpha/beta hydrolase fold domain-containing protein [Alteraurantiacibacter aestuarii]